MFPPVAASARSVPAGPNDLAERLAAILDAPALRHASVGVLVRSLTPDFQNKAGAPPQRRVLFERGADLALLPASNQKILTAGAALTRLGPAFRFETRAGYTGVLDKASGTVHGDIVLTGTGDPSLSSPRLGELARALAGAGIKRVTGRVVAEDRAFDRKRLGEGWQWDDEPFDYQPQVSALNCDGNVVRVTVTPGARADDLARVTLDPPTSYVRVWEALYTVAPGAKTRVTRNRERATNDLSVSGMIAAGAAPDTGALTVEEPSLFAATRLAELLAQNGVTVAGSPPARAGQPVPVTPVAVVRSEPLSVLVRDMMKRSDNLYAEALLKTVGGRPNASTAAGARVAGDLFRQAGGDPAALRVADGSGLSRLNLSTARNLVALLAYLADEQRAGAPTARAFVDALPIGGVDGTLRSRFKNTAAQNVVRAKTGSLSGVSALSGYLTTRAGEPLVFSILMNNVLAGTAAARAAQDALVLALMDAPAPPAEEPKPLQ